MNSPASTLDQLIRFHEGADYFREPEETRIPIWAGMIPAMIAAWAILGGVGYWIYEALL